MKRMIQWESIHELNAFRILDANPEVRAFHEQPCEIRFILNGERRRHYPDILVETYCAKEFWEIKPKAEAQKDKVVERSKLLTQTLPDLGYQYRVVHGEDLARSDRLRNVKLLLSQGRAEVPGAIREYIRQVVTSCGSVSMKKMLDASQGFLKREHLYSLILCGDLNVNIEQPFSDDMLLSPRFLHGLNGKGVS